jgi:hypothetical protein
VPVRVDAVVEAAVALDEDEVRVGGASEAR